MVSFPYFNNNLPAYYNGHSEQVFAEAGYPFNLLQMPVEPFARGSYIDVRTNFNETGGAASLYGSTSEDIFISTFGVRQSALLYNKRLQIFENIVLGWQHAYKNIIPQGRFAFVSGSSPFLIEGAPIARNALMVDAGLDFTRQDKNINFRLAYIGQISHQVSDNGVSGTAVWKLN